MNPDHTLTKPMTIFGPDFPFPYDDWLAHPGGLGSIPESAHGTEIAIIGAGISGMVAAYELLRLGLKPVIYEASHIGGRLRSVPFTDAPEGIIAELGGMRFPISSRSFFHYVDKLGIQYAPFPNPLTPAAGSTVINIESQTYYAEKISDLPKEFQDVENAWHQALSEAHFHEIQEAIKNRDAPEIKRIWNTLITQWDERTFYDFIAASSSFSQLDFRHKEIFGTVGFGTGGWDTDFPNSMLEVFRVVMTNCDEDQFRIIGGSNQIVTKLWQLAPKDIVHWDAGTSVHSINNGHTMSAVKKIKRISDNNFAITDHYGVERTYPVVLCTCQGWVLSTHIDCEGTLFSDKLWTAIEKTRYMQSSKTFVLVDRPFWKDKDPNTGRDILSMTLTDRLTRGTYLFDNGPDQPGVICLTYTWMSDALKMLPYTLEERVEFSLSVLEEIYPGLDIRSHIISEPITISWEADKHFLGAFKGALPGHYRYNERLYSHFYQKDFPPEYRGIFLAGDDVSWIPGWAEGAVQTALNAVWGIMNHLGGSAHPENPGPGELYPHIGPIRLDG